MWDLLDTYALALLQTEAICRAVATKPEATAHLLQEALDLRQRLVVDAKALIERRLVSPQLSTLRVPNGYRNVGSDLLNLATLLRETWPNIAGKSAVQLAELDRAEVLGEQLLYVIASRQRRAAAARVAANDRQRAFTLMVGAYNEVRWAVLYLRRHRDDADRFAPSLYRKRTAGRSAPSTKQVTKNDAAAAELRAPVGMTEHTADGQVTPAPRVPTKLTDPFIH